MVRLSIEEFGDGDGYMGLRDDGKVGREDVILEEE